MKRNLLVILACALIALCVISCDNHTHSYSDDWSSDATNHWHECSCGAKKDEAAHTFESWTVEGTNEKSTCSVCKYEATREISKWDGKNYDISWYEADKTKKEYTLTSAAQLAGLAKLVNGGTGETQLGNGVSFEGVTIKLACNINLGDQQWTPIGLYHDKNDTEGFKRKGFSGTFDGQGHTIIGLKIDLNESDKSAYRALFGYVCEGTVKDFTLNGTVTACDSAGVVAALSGGTISGVTSNVVVSTPKATTTDGTYAQAKVAGIVGSVSNKGSEKASKIENCTNNGAITSTAKTGTSAIGGIVAWQMSADLTVSNCKNTGNIKDTGSQDAGGIIGVTSTYKNGDDKSNVYTKTIITGCTNSGTITAGPDADKGIKGYGGGIVGEVWTYADVTINDCEPGTGSKMIGYGTYKTGTETKTVTVDE